MLITIYVNSVFSERERFEGYISETVQDKVS